jgi:hypothetical protein
MNCETAAGLMPALLNRTLAGAEADELRRHVADCAACGQDFEDTRRAAAVFAAHPSAAQLVDLAWGREDDLVRRHAEQCPECANELALARESRRAEDTADEGPMAATRRRWTPWIALPATLAAGLLIGLALPRSRPETAGSPPPGGDVPRLEAEVGRLRSAVAALEVQLEALRAPEPNLPVFELLPAGLTRGAPSPAPQGLTLPAEARQVALLLVADAAARTPASVEIRRAGGDVLWRTDGLRASPLGAYTLGVPASLLGAGDYVVRLVPRGAAAVEYHLRVTR